MIIKNKILRLILIVLPLYILQSILSSILLDYNSDVIDVGVTETLIIFPLIVIGYRLNFVLTEQKDRPKKSELKKFFKILLALFIIVMILLIGLGYLRTFGFSST